MIVSHDRTAIQSLCDRAILLEQGRILKDGNPEEVFDYYNAIIAEKEKSTVEVTKLGSGKLQTSSGTGEARVQEIALYNSKGDKTNHIIVGETVELRIKVKVFVDIESLVLGYGIKDRLGQVMYGTNTWHMGKVIDNPKVGEEYDFVITFPANLGEGSYSVVTALHAKEIHLDANYEWRDLALVFNMVNTDKVKFSGCNWMEPEIKV